MPIQLPDLDRKTYEELLGEMIAAIPKHTGEWTNFNPSDPGITILELLAWITKTLLYRANQIPEESYLNFLRLVTGPGVIYDPADQAHRFIVEYCQALENGGPRDFGVMKSEARRFLNSRYRLVTREDFRTLVIDALQALNHPEIFSAYGTVPGEAYQSLVLGAASMVKRIEVFPSYDKVTILMIPADKQTAGMAELAGVIRNYLEPRRLLGTVITFINPEYAALNLKIRLICKNHTVINHAAVSNAVKAAVETYLNPVTGGPDGTGWPYGRNLMVYELFRIVEGIPGVDHVAAVYMQNIGEEQWNYFTVIPVKGLIDLANLEVEVNINPVDNSVPGIFQSRQVLNLLS